MTTITLRGQSVKLDKANRKLFFTIRSALQSTTFSLNDRIQAYINNGYSAVISVGDKTVTVTKNSKVLNTKVMPSKFANMLPWKLYFYDVRYL